MWGGKTVELAIHSCYSQLARSWLYTAAIHSWLGAGYTQLLFTAGQELAIHSYDTQLLYTFSSSFASTVRLSSRVILKQLASDS